MLKKGKVESVNYVHAGNGKKPMNIGKTFKPYNSYGTNVVGAPSFSRGPQVYKGNYENIKCFFCKKHGHMKRDCEKHNKWAAKKGIKIISIFVCFELDLV